MITHWNYRLMVRIYKYEYKEEIKTEVDISVYTVYYNGKLPVSYSDSTISPCGESLQGFKEKLEMIELAAEKPILYYGDKFPQEYKENTKDE